jgi:hypothetical protein
MIVRTSRRLLRVAKQEQRLQCKGCGYALVRVVPADAVFRRGV